jgi:hypothetical protein
MKGIIVWGIFMVGWACTTVAGSILHSEVLGGLSIGLAVGALGACVTERWV